MIMWLEQPEKAIPIMTSALVVAGALIAVGVFMLANLLPM
jgi:hypothetical protein